MPKIRIDLGYVDIQHAVFTFAPGDKMEVKVNNSLQAAREWADGEADPGVTVNQAEILRSLVDDGLILYLDEDGELSVDDEFPYRL